MSKKWLILGSISFGVGLSLSLIINKDLKQAAWTGLLSVPATAAGVLVTEHQRQQKLNDRISTKQEQLQSLVKQEDNLNSSITSLSSRINDLKQQEENISVAVSSLNTDKQRSLQLATQSQSELNTLQNQIDELKNRKLEVEAKIAVLELRLEQLREQEIALSDSQKQIKIDLESDRSTNIQLQEQKSTLEQNLSDLTAREQELTEQLDNKQLSLDRLQQEQANLDREIALVSINKQKLERQFESQQQQLKTEINSLQAEVEELQAQKTIVSEDLANLAVSQESARDRLVGLSEKSNSIQIQLDSEEAEQQKLEVKLCELNEEVEQLKAAKQTLEVDYTTSTNRLTKLQDLISTQQQFKEQLEVNIEDTSALIPELDRTEIIIAPAIDIYDDDYNLSNAEHTKYLWENVVFPYWNHKDRPVGYRFLGNVDIDLEQSDRLTNLLKEKFQQSRGIPNRLEDNLLKIITFVLSEYAYYSDEEKFWKGFCDRLGIEHTNTVENTLREITEKGIDLLGLIRASGGYKYVSTLWLQSGIPKQNMGHFAAILGDVANEYGWWELSHSSTEDIAEVLWQCWQNRYSQWGTIKHFLKPNNTNQDIEPISGQLVKNIAIVARELERQDLAPKTISDREQREEIIANSNIDYSFFLRDWDDLVVVLDPRHNSSFSRIARRINPEPYLYLDLADTLNTLLILPEQSLWKNQWKNLRGSYCLIPEAEWEDTIPNKGNIEIPELEIDIKQATEKWRLQLQNHHRNEIYSWEHRGINSEFSCLIFDAISGNNIQVNLRDAKIIGIEEIIVFTPKEVEIELDNNIEIIDNFIPSSIRGWRGKEIRLTQSEGLIQIQNVVIAWRLQSEAQPKLIGLRLKGKKDIYINAPNFYYPPPPENLIISYSIEDINNKSIIAKDIFYTYDFNSWNSFDLSHYIKGSGNYYATFWHQEQQWSYKFEVRQEYQVTQYQGYRNLEICDPDRNFLSVPIKYTDLDKFWSAEIKLSNLYPFEEISFRLKNNTEQYQFLARADSSGELTLSLATLYDCLPKSDRYSLDVKKSGLEFQRVIQIGNLISWELTAKQLIFSEIPTADNYCLSGWNLLNPNLELEKIDFLLLNSQQTTVRLGFSPGIYLIQLNQNGQIIENIGLWCCIDPQNVRDRINNNEALANYCYTILDNEPIADFCAALEELEVDFDRERIQIILESLDSDNYYLPQWLDKDSFTGKIQKILASLLQPETLETNNIVAEASTISGQWCLVTVRPYKRELFIKYLNSDIEQQQLQQSILEIIEPEESVYSNMILLRITNFAKTRTLLQQIDYFQAVGRLDIKQVNRMLNR